MFLAFLCFYCCTLLTFVKLQLTNDDDNEHIKHKSDNEKHRIAR